jgi:hypothetical protein
MVIKKTLTRHASSQMIAYYNAHVLTGANNIKLEVMQCVIS